MLRVPGVFVVQPSIGPIQPTVSPSPGGSRPPGISREIDGDKAESRASHAIQEPLPQFFVSETAYLRRRDLDTGKIAVEPHPILAETEPGHDLLGLRNTLETEMVIGVPVGNRDARQANSGFDAVGSPSRGSALGSRPCQNRARQRASGRRPHRRRGFPAGDPRDHRC